MPAAPVGVAVGDDQVGRAVVGALQRGVRPVVALHKAVGDAVEGDELDPVQRVDAVTVRHRVGDDQLAVRSAGKGVVRDRTGEDRTVGAGPA